jgi:hypothetical protein
MVARPVGDKTLIDAENRRRGCAREQRNDIGESRVRSRRSCPRAPALMLRGSHGAAAPRALHCGQPCRSCEGAPLMAAMAERVGSPAVKLVHIHDDDALTLSDICSTDWIWTTIFRSLWVARRWRGKPRHAELERKFKDVVDTATPKAVVVFDGGSAAVGCATIARSMGIPVVRVGAGLRVDPSPVAEARGRKSTEALADLWYPSDEKASQALANEGVPAARIHCAGNLLIDAVQIAVRALQDPMGTGAFHRMVIPFSSEVGHYALVLIEDPEHIADRQSVVALIAFLRRISRSIALVLLMRSDAKREFDKHLLPREMFGERICHLPGQAYANQIELLRNAVCVLTDSRDCCEEATALSTPCLAIGVRAGPAGLAPGGTATIGAKARAAAWGDLALRRRR